MPVSVEGLQALERALDELPTATQKNVLRRVGRQALRHFLAAVKNNVRAVSGTTRDSYVIGTRLTRRQARAARAEGKSSIEIYAGTADPAGVQLEFGNKDMAAQPHARSAWESTQAATLEEIKDLLWTEIKRAADRLARKAGR